jgi:protein-S-isoprenylcysteine O-methyltransferase Ste14
VRRIIVLTYGLVAYGMGLAAFVYLIGFVGEFGVPKAADTSRGHAPGSALAVNLLLATLFGLQHSVMARRSYKATMAAVVPGPVERSTYVVATAAVLAFLFWGWSGSAEVVWSVGSAQVRGVMWGLFGAGWLIAVASTFLVSHLDLFGVAQAWRYFQGLPPEAVGFRSIGFYRWVRHPLMSGLLLAFWSAPTMTVGRLAFVSLMTIYVVVGILLEERTLEAEHGDEYRAYKASTPRLVPRLIGARATAGAGGGPRGG